MEHKLSITQRILNRTATSEDGCQIWLGQLDRNGYGVISFKGKKQKVHRLVYEESWGKIPERYEVDHLCNRRDCVEPMHLEAVSKLENANRRGRRNKQLITHCPNGHEYTIDNIYTPPLQKDRQTPSRMCRKCRMKRK